MLEKAFSFLFKVFRSLSLQIKVKTTTTTNMEDVLAMIKKMEKDFAEEAAKEEVSKTDIIKPIIISAMSG